MTDSILHRNRFLSFHLLIGYYRGRGRCRACGFLQSGRRNYYRLHENPFLGRDDPGEQGEDYKATGENYSYEPEGAAKKGGDEGINIRSAFEVAKYHLLQNREEREIQQCDELRSP